jgi:hypothetical protein
MSHNNRIMALSICVMIFVSLSSCASPHFTASKDFDIATEQIHQKIPLRVGLFLPPALKNYKQALYPFLGDFFVGDAFCSGSERIMKSIFQEVILLDKPIMAPAHNVDVFITPQVQRLDIFHGFKEKEVVFHADFKWNITSPDGKILYTNVIKGEYIEPHGKVFYAGLESPSTRSEKFMKLYMLAITDQFQKAQQDIYSNAWWKNQWWIENK